LSCFSVSHHCQLLIAHGNDQIDLYDLSISSVKSREIPWNSNAYGLIRDISWSKHINAFLVLGQDVLCSYSPLANQFQIHLNLSSMHDRFWSMTVLGCETFVLHRNDQLHRYCLSSWTLTQQWSRQQLILDDSIDKYLEQIRAHEAIGLLAVLIRLRNEQRWRIDIFDRQMQRLYTGESLRMASVYPRLMLQPFGQHGRWTLTNENKIWIVNFNGHFLERSSRKSVRSNSNNNNENNNNNNKST